MVGYSNNYIESEMVKGNSEKNSEKTYEYDEKKNPIKSVNCYGVKTSYEYKEDTNELIKKTIESNTNGCVSVDYGYDNGDLTNVSDSTGKNIGYIYDD